MRNSKTKRRHHKMKKSKFSNTKRFNTKNTSGYQTEHVPPIIVKI